MTLFAIHVDHVHRFEIPPIKFDLQDLAMNVKHTLDVSPEVLLLALLIAAAALLFKSN